jgi:succinate dehydrogenase / fumarate reductase membrane anchor subunit
MSMKTPLKQVRGLGAAKDGTSHFWQQRMTGLANLLLVLFLIGFVLLHLGASRADVVSSFRNPLIAILFLLSFASILWHMKLGLQVVIEDYIHRRAALILALVANTFYVALLGAAALYAILKMSFGA